MCVCVCSKKRAGTGKAGLGGPNVHAVSPFHCYHDTHIFNKNFAALSSIKIVIPRREKIQADFELAVGQFEVFQLDKGIPFSFIFSSTPQADT